MNGFRVHPTPNPNSLKVTTTAGPFIRGGMESFGSAREAASHPLGATLFEVPGVSNVFILPDFLTVTKTSDASWDAIWPAVEERLARLAAEGLFTDKSA